MRTHVSLDVRDLARSTKFYRTLFGDPVREKPGYAKFESDTPPLILSLVATSADDPPSRSRISHLGVQVATASELDALRERCTTAGLELIEERETECCYAVADKVWVSDPDGTPWELYRRLGDSERLASDRNESAPCGTVNSTCCTVVA